MSFNKILEKYRKISFSERDKGNRFERLMQAYLQTDPKYSFLFKSVWLWNEFPGKLDLGGGDTGIDLVTLTHDGDYWAIQCKCFQEDALIDKPAVDSFLSTSSRKFKGVNLQTTGFAHRLWISTTNHWGANATEAIKNQHPPVTRVNLTDLQDAPVDWHKLEEGVHGESLLCDNIEDKGMQPDRSKNFQNIIVNLSNSYIAKNEHQIIFSTSMIAEDLEGTPYCVGDYYTIDGKTLKI